MLYKEVASPTPAVRGRMVPLDSLGEEINRAKSKDLALFFSLFSYDEAVIRHMAQYKTIRRFEGDHHPDHLCIDIDKGSMSDKDIMKNLDNVYETLVKLRIPANSIRIYFSGRGFHIELHKDLFNFTPSPRLPYLYQQWVIDNIGHQVDESIYSRGRLFRVANTKNEKSGLYKIELHPTEALNYEYSRIVEMASVNREITSEDFSAVQIFDINKISRRLVSVNGQVKLNTRDGIFVNREVNTCFHNMYDEGAQKGTRHITMMTMASLMWRNGVPVRGAQLMLRDWAGNYETSQISDREIEKIIKDCYKRGYTPACDGEGNLSKVMQKHCSKDCRYYKDMASMVNPIDMNTAESSFRARLSSGDAAIINFAKFCEVDKECSFETGQLVTIMGSSGRGKTALAQNLLLGIEHPTLYISLEMSESQMFRRFQQASHGLSKKDVEVIYESGESLSCEKIKNIDIVTAKLDFGEIQEILRRKKYKIIVIDHLKLLKLDPSRVTAELAQYTGKFKEIANRYGYLIILISQVRREVTRGLEALDATAASGSKSIEEDSDIVISTTGDEASDLRIVKVNKNREGDMFTKQFKHNGKTMQYIPVESVMEEETPKVPRRGGVLIHGKR
jgi:KaiC/GvpD/RAD55 family RecA-like ATPase